MGVLYARPEAARDLSQLLALQGPASAPGPVAQSAPVLVAASAPIPPATVGVAIKPPTLAAASAAPAKSGDDKAAPATSKQQEFVTSWLSKRYRVAGDAATMFVSTAYSTAREVKIDPLLILAVMAIESGLNPFAESPVGAQGLMQVMSKVHHDKFRPLGGVQAALNPVANIRVGSQLLKEYMNRGGSVEAGLKTYVGAGAFDSDSGYGSRVIAEYNKLKQVATGKKVPTKNAAPAPTLLVDKSAPKAAETTVPAAAATAASEEPLAGL